jgi:hypothetical protein
MAGMGEVVVIEGWYGLSGQLQRWSGDDGAAAMDWADCGFDVVSL